MGGLNVSLPVPQVIATGLFGIVIYVSKFGISKAGYPEVSGKNPKPQDAGSRV